jgi:hypothetical protein
VWIGAHRPLVILVPAAEGTYLLKDLVRGGHGLPTTDLVTGDNYLIRDTSLLLLNASTGTWHPIWWSTITGDNQFAIGETGATYPGNYRISDTSLQLLHADTEAWHAPGVTEAFQLFQGPADEPLAGNYRVRDRMLQILNLDTGDWHTIYLYGALAAPQLAIGIAHPS